MKAAGIVKTVAVAATAIVLVCLCLYYYTNDPDTTFSFKCTFKVLTGYDCPGCGSQRAFHAFLHGEFVKAWTYNPLVFFAVPTGVYYLIVEAGRYRWPRLHAASVNPIVLIVFFVAVLSFWIGRNL